MKNKKTFTLVEMLVVVIIIGILAAALVPKIKNAAARANNAKRLSDIRQIATAISSYQNDNGGIAPLYAMNTTDKIYTGLDKILVPTYLTAMPLDPLYKRASYLMGIYTSDPWHFGRLSAGEGDGSHTPWVSVPTNAPASYSYMPLKLNGKIGGSFLLMALTNESPDLANRIIYPDSPVSPGVFVNAFQTDGYVQYYELSGASMSLNILVDAKDIISHLCKRVIKNVDYPSYTYPFIKQDTDGRYICYDARTSSSVYITYGYTTIDNFARYIYVQ